MRNLALKSNKASYAWFLHIPVFMRCDCSKTPLLDHLVASMLYTATSASLPKHLPSSHPYLMLLSGHSWCTTKRQGPSPNTGVVKITGIAIGSALQHNPRYHRTETLRTGICWPIMGGSNNIRIRTQTPIQYTWWRVKTCNPSVPFFDATDESFVFGVIKADRDSFQKDWIIKWNVHTPWLSLLAACIPLYTRHSG